MDFKRFGKNSFMCLYQQCCSSTNCLLFEAITMVNAAERSISKRSRDTPSCARPVYTQIDVRLLQKSSKYIDLHGPTEEGWPIKRFVKNDSSQKEVSSVPSPSGSSVHETLRMPNRKARSVSSRKNKILTTRVSDNHPRSYNVCNTTEITTPMKDATSIRGSSMP